MAHSTQSRISFVNTETTSTGKQVNVGAIAGIIVGVALPLVIVMIYALCGFTRSRLQGNAASTNPSAGQVENGHGLAHQPRWNFAVSEGNGWGVGESFGGNRAAGGWAISMNTNNAGGFNTAPNLATPPPAYTGPGGKQESGFVFSFN